MNDNSGASRERIEDEAAAWVIRLADQPTLHDRARFEEWRTCSVAHEIAFERESATWERLDQLKGRPSPTFDLAVFSSNEANAASLRPAIRRPWRAIAASVAALGGLGALLATSLTAAPAYATGIGERRLVHLKDGSSVELNTDSRIIVRYGNQRRSVELVRGEVLFHIVRDARPFVIASGDAEVDSEAAEFSVHAEQADTKVVVKAGTVSASDTATGSDVHPITPLSAGSEAVIAGTSVIVHALSADEIERSLAWLKGGIALDGQTLAQAAAEFNRYNVRKLEIGDTRVGTLQIGGFFQSSDVDGFVAALTRAFPINAATGRDGGIVLTSKS